jgi:initiation factor 1A
MGGKNKNTHGGSGYKKFANKSFQPNRTNTRLRVSDNDSEIYAIVLKMVGFGTFKCYCIDGKERLGHIPGKFKGRNKRENMVEMGKWVLIGLREYCSKGDQCDLLEIYSDSDKMRLRDSVENNWRLLDEQDRTKPDENEDSDVEFGTERDFERARIEEEMKTSKLETIRMGVKDDDIAVVDDVINVDDI